jgi:hypothetical protein
VGAIPAGIFRDSWKAEVLPTETRITALAAIAVAFLSAMEPFVVFDQPQMGRTTWSALDVIAAVHSGSLKWTILVWEHDIPLMYLAVAVTLIPLCLKRGRRALKILSTLGLFECLIAWKWGLNDFSLAFSGSVDPLWNHQVHYGPAMFILPLMFFGLYSLAM